MLFRSKEGTNPLLLSRFAHQGSILRLTYSPDGARLLSASDDRTVKLWEAGDARELYQIDPKGAEWPTSIAFAADGASFVVGRHDGSLAMHETRTGAKIRDVAPQEKPPAPPELARASVRGLQRGKTTRATIYGRHLK